MEGTSIMTPPLTDAELLAYIERTPELKRLLNVLFPVGWSVSQEQEHLLYGPRDITRAFHANEQRVREEAAVVIRALNDSTAPQLSTADQPACVDCAPEFACWGGRIACCKQPVLNSTEQGEAVEAVGLLRSVLRLLDGAHDASAQYEDMRGYTAEQIRDFLAKQGGK